MRQNVMLCAMFTIGGVLGMEVGQGSFTGYSVFAAIALAAILFDVWMEGRDERTSESADRSQEDKEEI